MLNTTTVCNRTTSIDNCDFRLVQSRFQGIILFGCRERFDHGTLEKVVIHTGSVNPSYLFVTLLDCLFLLISEGYSETNMQLSPCNLASLWQLWRGQWIQLSWTTFIQYFFLKDNCWEDGLAAVPKDLGRNGLSGVFSWVSTLDTIQSWDWVKQGLAL